MSVGLASFKIAALKIEVFEQYLIVKFDNSVNFIVLFDRGKSNSFSPILNDKHSRKLLGES